MARRIFSFRRRRRSPRCRRPIWSARATSPLFRKGLTYGRATRAARQLVENFAAFVAVDLAFDRDPAPGGIWPTIWIIARIVYLPLYLFDITYVPLRLHGAFGLVAIVVMLVRLAI